MRDLPHGLRRYLTFLYAACLTLLVYQLALSLRHGLPAHLDTGTVIRVAVFIGLTYVAEHTTLQIKGAIWQNLATTTHIGALLLFAPPFPVLISVAAAVVSQVRHRNTALAKRAFNVAHPALSVGLTGLVCSLLFRPADLLRNGFLLALPNLTVVLALFYLFDVCMMLGLLVLLGKGSPWQVWWQAYRHTLLPELAAGTVGILGAIVWRYDPAALTLLVLPVTALRAAFRANAQAEERAQALRQRGSQLETVLEVGQHLRLQQTRADLLQAVAVAARVILGAETVTGYLRDEEDSDLLRRIALAPTDATAPGPAYLSVTDCSVPAAAGEIRVPIESDGVGVAGLLLVTGAPETTSDADGDVLGILATQAAIALQNAYLHERALALAAHDSLTNLLNRRAVQTRLEAEIARAERGGHPLCLLMVDLDDFSAINNTYGHAAGDTTLRTVAHLLATSVRAMDVTARYGGDEFLVLLPETTLEQGLMSAERLREALAALRVIDGAVSVSLTASIGVAGFSEHGSTPEELLRAADQGAYAAKHAGKGCVARPESAVLALDRDPMVLAAQLAHANMATVAALAAAVDAKDPYTQGHSQRVSRYAAALAHCMELPALDIARIQLAGQLHDVVKFACQTAS